MSESTRPQQQSQQRSVIPPNPKGFFANERTFLSWLQLCLALGGAGIGLLNFGSPLAQTAGVIFGIIAVAFMFYSLIQYHVRGDRLQQKEKGTKYEDMVGALAMVTVVLVAVAINFGMQFLVKSA